MSAPHRRGTRQAPAGLPLIWDLFGTEGIGPRILLLAKMVERATSRQLQAEFGISVAQWRVLAFLCMAGPATASFMGEAAEVDQAEISRAVKALVRDKLVVREFAPGSRKTMVIAPTAAGEALFGRIRQRRRDYFARITRGVAPPERAAIARALDTIAEAVVAERGPPVPSRP